jgi:hypothetical protein
MTATQTTARIPPIVHQINGAVAEEESYVAQRTEGRFAAVDTIAAAAVPNADGKTYALELERFDAILTTGLGRLAPILARLRQELHQARIECQLFLAEHRLERAPPCEPNIMRTIEMIVGAMLLEAAATTWIYLPAVNIGPALVISALISAGVAFPAVFLAMGLVLSKHRLSYTYWLTGLATTALASIGVVVAVFSTAHFRLLVGEDRTLVAHPMRAAQKVWASLIDAPLHPLVEPSNWGLIAAAGLAAAVVAWKVFGLFGYLGWRRLAVKQHETIEAIHAQGSSACAHAEAGMNAGVRAIDSRADDAKVSLKRIAEAVELNKAVSVAHRSAMAEISRQLAGARAKVVLVLNSAGLLEPNFPPAISERNFDRQPFERLTRQATDQHEALIAARPEALAYLRERYAKYCVAVQRLVETALTAPPPPMPRNSHYIAEDEGPEL